MATRTPYVKIGFLVLLGAGAFLALGVFIGLSRVHRQYVSYYTYFDEAVTGLAVGSAVRARGVPLGQVGNITFAPDHRMVEVRSDIDVAELERIGFHSPEETEFRPVPPNVRAQLASQGLTGLRYIALDIFDEETNPPPKLTFPQPTNYIPAARSVQKSLEEAATTALEGLASLVEALKKEQLSEKVVQATADAGEVLTQLQLLIRRVDEEKLPQRAGRTFDELRETAGRINRVLARVEGESGLLSTTQRSVNALGEAGRSASDTTHSLSDTLQEVRSAAEAIRILADRIERDPDMLLKGRAKDERP
jgi:ABC-type transporter Mla subunit MlaD